MAAMPFHLFLLLPLFLNSALTMNVSNECKALNALVCLSLVFSQRTKTVTYVMSPCLGRQLMTSDTKPGKTSKMVI